MITQKYRSNGCDAYHKQRYNVTFISFICPGPEFSNVKVTGCHVWVSYFEPETFHTVYVSVLRSISFSSPHIWKLKNGIVT